MKKFQEYIKEGIVRKRTPNRQRAISLMEESDKKKAFLDISMKSIPKAAFEEQPFGGSSNFIADYCYDIIMELLRAKMVLEGLNAGNSHEAEVSYMLMLGFTEEDAKTMDELRYYRNGIKYYGTILDMEYALKALQFMQKVSPRLRMLILET